MSTRSSSTREHPREYLDRIQRQAEAFAKQEIKMGMFAGQDSQALREGYFQGFIAGFKDGAKRLRKAK